MAEIKEPLTKVRKSFRVDWYRSPIDPKTLRKLMQRSNHNPNCSHCVWYTIAIALPFLVGPIWIIFFMPICVPLRVYLFTLFSSEHSNIFRP